MPRQITALIFLFLINCSSGLAQSKYLGQSPPSKNPEIFAPGIISLDNRYEFGSFFSEDGLEFFFGVAAGPEQTWYSKFENGQWSKPKVILSHDEYGMNDPFLSNDGHRLYYISKKALKGDKGKGDYDIWYSERKVKGWSKPINAGSNINTKGNEYYISFTKSGAMYFASNHAEGHHDIYKAESRNGKFQKPVRLGPNINTEHYEGDVFIDPNERYIIFAGERPGGAGRGDLYISFKKEDGSWTKSKSMGSKINTSGHELCPFVTKDGKYFFYTSNSDIYWVDAKIIDDLR